MLLQEMGEIRVFRQKDCLCLSAARKIGKSFASRSPKSRNAWDGIPKVSEIHFAKAGVCPGREQSAGDGIEPMAGCGRRNGLADGLNNEALAKPPSSVLQAQYSEARSQDSESELIYSQRLIRILPPGF